MKIIHTKIKRESLTDMHLASGLLSRCGEVFRAEGLERVLLISDANVAALYAAPVQRALRRAGISSDLFVFPPGEKSKTLAEAGRAYKKLIGMKADRRT